MRFRALAVPGLFSLLAACASTSAPPEGAPPPVKVVVSSAPDVGKLVDAEALTRLTEAALRTHAAGAAPMTIDVRFESRKTEFRNQGVPGIPMSRSISQSVVIASPTPWMEPSRPVVEHHSYSRWYVHPGGRDVAYGTYTITGANGVVLERKRIELEDVTAGIAIGVRDQKWVARYLARRAAELSVSGRRAS